MRGRTNWLYGLVAVLACAALVAGCGTEKASGPAADAGAAWKVVFDITTENPLVLDNDNDLSFNSGYGEHGPDSVVISWGAALIRSVRFEEGTTGPVDTDITAEDKSRDMSDPDIFLKGPYPFAVNGSVQNLGTDEVVPGTYNRVVFVIEPGAASDDLGGFDDLVGHSIVVAGHVWHNGQPRTFKFTTDYASEFSVPGNFSLSSGVTTNLQLEFNAGRWFKVANRWLDPSDSGNRVRILENIRRNIHAGSGA